MCCQTTLRSNGRRTARRRSQEGVVGLLPKISDKVDNSRSICPSVPTVICQIIGYPHLDPFDQGSENNTLASPAISPALADLRSPRDKPLLN
jgi:hypothetical protein